MAIKTRSEIAKQAWESKKLRSAYYAAIDSAFEYAEIFGGHTAAERLAKHIYGKHWQFHMASRAANGRP